MSSRRHPDTTSIRRALTSVLVALGLLVAGAVTAGPSPAAEKAIWGPLTLPGGASAFPTYRDLGLDTLQLQLNWRATAPSRPANPANPGDPGYRWPAEIDRALSEAATNGINVALQVQVSPAGANGGRSSIHAPNAA